MQSPVSKDGHHIGHLLGFVRCERVLGDFEDAGRDVARSLHHLLSVSVKVAEGVFYLGCEPVGEQQNTVDVVSANF